MARMTLEERIAHDTAHAARHLAEGFTFLRLRGRLRMLTPFNIKSMKGQTHEHSLLSENGHEFVEAEDGLTRKCSRCLKLEFRGHEEKAGQWFPMVSTNFTTEGIHHLVHLSARAATEKLPDRKLPE